MNSKEWLFLSIVTFLTVMTWTVYDVYHAAITSTLTPYQQTLLKPLDPAFDSNVLDRIEQKEQ
ncbi:MAG TPA: hypothetical protein VJL83_04200 [Patescibacteria group bacterium]|nr:hypothetical protein [Patescibacteria group bacterium]